MIPPGTRCKVPAALNHIRPPFLAGVVVGWHAGGAGLAAVRLDDGRLVWRTGSLVVPVFTFTIPGA